MVTATLQGLFISQKIDAVIATSPQFFCGCVGVICHLLRKWTFLLEIRDIWPESIIAVGAMKKSLTIRILEKIEKLNYRSASHIITVNKGCCQSIIERGISPKKISIIPNGVDIQFFKSRVPSQDFRNKFRSKGKFVCAYIGTIGMAHGLEVIVKAAERCLHQGRSDVIFWMVGDGAAREELEMQARSSQLNNIIFTGRIDKIKIPEVISSCDACLVHLKDTELFSTATPSKMFEFMAMDVPIIMGVRGQALEIVLEAGAGVAMIPENAQSLIECINQIQRKGRKYFSGREYVARNFERQKMASRMLNIVKNYARTGSINPATKNINIC
jgi:glycosyltransferase involved in cell wall biosynthesis